MSSEPPKTRTLPFGPELSKLSYAGFRLDVVSGNDAGQSATFTERVVEIGTSPKCDFMLTDRTVSAHHCLIEVTEEAHRLQDLGSRNGTRIAACRVGWALLASGVVVQIGGTDVRFELAGTVHEVELATTRRMGRMVGRSEAMRALYASIRKIASGDSTVLIEAESGSGKEVAAEAIHQASARAEGPFEVFDCASVPPNLVESELFGHERGAFTGATARHEGAFERASGGTLFLDEIGELPEALQPRLLRALEAREVRRVGGRAALETDVRVIAATNRDLAAMVKEGRFRLDLYHRLAVIDLRIPPLRHRADDIPLLVDHFLETHRRAGRPAPAVSQEALARLRSYRWPGNVRELRNFVERGVVLGEDFDDLPFLSPNVEERVDGASTLDGPLPPYHLAKGEMVDAWERGYCERLLRDHAGNVAAAARAAGMNRKSLMYLLAKHGLRDYRR